MSRNVLTHYRDDVPDTVRGAAEQELAALRSEIAAFARRFDLQPRDRSRRQALKALLVSEMLRIEDSLSSRLAGYGAVDPALRDALDPVLRRVRDRFAHLLELVTDDASDPARHGEPLPPDGAV